MRKQLLSVFIILLSFQSFAQSTQYKNNAVSKQGTMVVEYLENYPYAYKDKNGDLTGVEIDIIKQYVKWLKEKKGMDVVVSYNGYNDFAQFYSDVRNIRNASMGAGTVTITSDRAREVRFSSPYLKNKPLLISSINIPTLTDISRIAEAFDGKIAVIVKGSVHEKWINKIKAEYWPSLRVDYVESPAKVIEMISASEDYFGYLDLVTYWAALQGNSKPLKLHRLNQSSYENFGFIFPKDSQWYSTFNEFFDSGLGFPATQAYTDILKKHLGEEIISSVAVQY
jgi:ABC-type amino acid transport substrate-binding protein